MIRREAWVVALCLALTCAAFAPALGFGFVYDDNLQLVGNPNAHGWQGLSKAFTSHVWSFDPAKAALPNKYYRPLFMCALTLGWQAFGARPFGYHAIALLLHLACGLLAYWWFVEIGLAVPVRVAGLALFMLHPAQIQVGAWISALSESMLGCLAFGCLLAWLRWLRNRARSNLVLALAFYGLSMLVLERAISLAGPLLLLGWFSRALTSPEPAAPPAARQRLRDAALQALLLAAPAACVLALRRAALGPNALQAGGWLRDTLFTAPAVALRYLRILAWPDQLSLAYPERFLSSVSLGDTVIPLAVAGAALALGCLLSRGRPPRLFLLGSAITLLAPALCVGLLPGHALVQDRYMYLPMAFLGPWLGDVMLAAPDRSSFPARARGTLLAIWLVALLAMHPGNLAPWRDNLALFSRAVAATPDSPSSLSMLARERLARGLADPSCGISRYAAALVRAHQNWADPAVIHFNLGLCEAAQGRREPALAAYNYAYRHSSGTMLPAGVNRVSLLDELGHTREALRAAEELTRIHPNSAEAFGVYGVSAALAGERDTAEAALRRALALDPDNQGTRALLSRLANAKPR